MIQIVSAVTDRRRDVLIAVRTGQVIVAIEIPTIPSIHRGRGADEIMIGVGIVQREQFPGANVNLAGIAVHVDLAAEDDQIVLSVDRQAKTAAAIGVGCQRGRRHAERVAVAGHDIDISQPLAEEDLGIASVGVGVEFLNFQNAVGRQPNIRAVVEFNLGAPLIAHPNAVALNQRRVDDGVEPLRIGSVLNGNVAFHQAQSRDTPLIIGVRLLRGVGRRLRRVSGVLLSQKTTSKLQHREYRDSAYHCFES